MKTNKDTQQAHYNLIATKRPNGLWRVAKGSKRGNTGPIALIGYGRTIKEAIENMKPTGVDRVGH